MSGSSPNQSWLPETPAPLCATWDLHGRPYLRTSQFSTPVPVTSPNGVAATLRSAIKSRTPPSRARTGNLSSPGQRRPEPARGSSPALLERNRNYAGGTRELRSAAAPSPWFRACKNWDGDQGLSGARAGPQGCGGRTPAYSSQGACALLPLAGRRAVLGQRPGTLSGRVPPPRLLCVLLCSWRPWSRPCRARPAGSSSENTFHVAGWHFDVSYPRGRVVWMDREVACAAPTPGPSAWGVCALTPGSEKDPRLPVRPGAGHDCPRGKACFCVGRGDFCRGQRGHRGKSAPAGFPERPPLSSARPRSPWRRS